MKKFKLKAHQQEAHDAVIKEFKVADKCHIVMACGTGKTLTALRISETLAPNSVVIFVPSLNLIAQFMKEWIKYTEWNNFETLVICSDDDITKPLADSIIEQDIDLPVSRNPEDIRKFLNHKNKNIKLIFCTYHSTHILSEGIANLHIDLAIFDEAHRTAGVNKTLFSDCLKEGVLNIKKRLFMTATPRHGAMKKDAHGNEKQVFSMDNISFYGRRAYTLSFRKAINLGLICDYKVIISVVNASSYEAIEEYEFAEKFTALNKAIKKTGAKKIVTFHSTIKQAKEFSKFYLNHANKEALHINGKISAIDRAQILNEFKSKKDCLLTNSRCLTEGVDIPAIDMIGFLSPKASRIDIVQAIGRALRVAPNKKIGYVFLPLMLVNNDLEQIRDSEYKDIWAVLHSLAEQDSELEDVVKNMARKQGRGSHRNILGDNITFIGPNPGINRLIEAKILDNLYSSWDVNYGKLIEYKALYGNCEVQESYKDTKLASWISNQRSDKKDGLLSLQRIELLDKLGFNWAILENAWLQNYNKLKAYKAKFGTTKVTAAHDSEYHSLYKWCESQRRRFHKVMNNKRESAPILSQERKNLLLEIGFDFGSEYKSLKNLFDIRLMELKKYTGKTKNINIKDSDPNKILVHWLQKQRQNYLANKLSKIEIKTLQEAGIILDVFGTIWQNKYNECKEAKKNNSLTGAHLQWARLQIKKHGDGKLSDDKYKLASKLFKDGIDLKLAKDKIDPRFQENVKRIIAFHKQKGHFYPQYKDNPALYNWALKQRLLYARKELHKKYIDTLNAINFPWESDQRDFQYEKWLKTFNEYKKYHKKFNKQYGVTYDGIPAKIINFRSICRSHYRRGLLDKRKIEALQSINFDCGK